MREEEISDRMRQILKDKAQKKEQEHINKFNGSKAQAIKQHYRKKQRLKAFSHSRTNKTIAP